MEELQQAVHLDSTLVDYCQPAIEDFPQGGLPGHLSARQTPRFRLPKTFPSCRTQFASATLGEGPEESPASANAMLDRFPKVHARAPDPHSFSYTDGSEKKTGAGQQTDEGGRSQSIGTLTGTGLIMATPIKS